MNRSATARFIPHPALISSTRTMPWGAPISSIHGKLMKACVPAPMPIAYARIIHARWDDLRYVLAIHREKTLSGAASNLGVTRTTVGRRLKEAEDRLGVRLFDRTDDGLAATAAGEELASTALRLEEEIHVTEGRLRGRDAELRGRLRVSTVDFVFAGFPDVFSTFIQRYPGVDMTVNVTNEAVSLVRRDADVAVRIGNSPADRLLGRRVGRLQFEAYADDYAVRRLALSAGIGVHFLPCFDGDADPALVRIGARLGEEARDLWVLTLPELRNNSRIRAFMDHFHTALEPRQQLLEG